MSTEDQIIPFLENICVPRCSTKSIDNPLIDINDLDSEIVNEVKRQRLSSFVVDYQSKRDIKNI